MKNALIGCIYNGVDGNDIYRLFTPEEADFDADPHVHPTSLVVRELEALYYEQSSGPGSRFCTSFLVVETYEGSGNFIGIAHIRWDV